MGGTLSIGQNNESTVTDGNNSDSLQMRRMDWREEVIKHVNKHQNPQMRQLNYERNIREYDSVLKTMSEKENKTYYQICKDYLGY